jgi:hypothetical protein
MRWLKFMWYLFRPLLLSFAVLALIPLWLLSSLLAAVGFGFMYAWDRANGRTPPDFPL